MGFVYVSKCLSVYIYVRLSTCSLKVYLISPPLSHSYFSLSPFPSPLYLLSVSCIHVRGSSLRSPWPTAERERGRISRPSLVKITQKFRNEHMFSGKRSHDVIRGVTQAPRPYRWRGGGGHEEPSREFLEPRWVVAAPSGVPQRQVGVTCSGQDCSRRPVTRVSFPVAAP